MTIAPEFLEALERSTAILKEELRSYLKGYCMTEYEVESIRDSADRMYVQRYIDQIDANEKIINCAKVEANDYPKMLEALEAVIPGFFAFLLVKGERTGDPDLAYRKCGPFLDLIARAKGEASD